MSSFPTVTVIVPTTLGRLKYHERFINMVCKQDYPSIEVLFDYEDGLIGTKRNRLCERATGEVIVPMDDDDLYANNWVSKSVIALMSGDYDVVGLHTINLYDEVNKQGWQYSYLNNLFPPTRPVNYLCGATFCYYRKFWEQNKFPDSQVGEDAQFVFGRSGIRVKVFHHGYVDGFLASIHEGNTSKRLLHSINYRRCSEEEENKIRKNFLVA